MLHRENWTPNVDWTQTTDGGWVFISPFDQVNIVSTFPGMGKTTAAAELAYDTGYTVIDVDSAELKKSLPADLLENWVNYYIDHIEGLYKMYRTMPDVISKKTVVFILVSSHQEVRAALQARGMVYYYIVPNLSMVDQVIKAAKGRFAAIVDNMQSGGHTLIHNYDADAALRAATAISKNGHMWVMDAIENTKNIQTERLMTIGATNVQNIVGPIWLTSIITGGAYKLIDNNTRVGYGGAIDRDTAIYYRKALWKQFNQLYKDIGKYVFDITLDQYGHIVVRTKNRLTDGAILKIMKKAGVSMSNAYGMAYADMPCIIVDKKDAENLYKMLSDVLADSGMADEQLWPDTGISYERLADGLSCTLMPLACSFTAPRMMLLHSDDASTMSNYAIRDDVFDNALEKYKHLKAAKEDLKEQADK